MAFFRSEIQNGAEVLVPEPRARSGWSGPGQIRGTAVSGALGRAAERAVSEWDDVARFRPVRWTVDLFRPAAMAPVSTSATVVRQGRRLRLVDAHLLQDGKVVARASALLLATDGAPVAGEVWSGDPARDDPAAALPPVPDIEPETKEQALYFSEELGWTGGAAPHRNATRKAVWHLPEALVDGETPTPFQRIATVADSSNLAGSWGSHGVEFINADLTLTVTRLPPDDGGIGIIAEGRNQGDGIAVAHTSLFDRTGLLGTVVLSTLANGAAAVDPRAAGL
ncbi:thioesterase superfamily protein [Pseudonocardia sediminis]|uniref:Thioesterase superfamily protein n=1 Tax=Pseudonocardia sediminis TaxID=1397368 RepID=A0A4Q7UYM0_PSEST|nr:thioesterase family protein [Pseudonocardia sediminis]RZT86905.1 thioesterase superfamily protein [Pseudonocardia sediminis]